MGWNFSVKRCCMTCLQKWTFFGKWKRGLPENHLKSIIAELLNFNPFNKGKFQNSLKLPPIKSPTEWHNKLNIAWKKIRKPKKVWKKFGSLNSFWKKPGSPKQFEENQEALKNFKEKIRKLKKVKKKKKIGSPKNLWKNRKPKIPFKKSGSLKFLKKNQEALKPFKKKSGSPKKSKNI